MFYCSAIGRTSFERFELFHQCWAETLEQRDSIPYNYTRDTKQALSEEYKSKMQISDSNHSGLLKLYEQDIDRFDKSPSDGHKRDTTPRDELINTNLRYVVALAKQSARRFPGVEMEDLIQAGNVGLIKAAERFDSQKAGANHTTFRTYAYMWIMKHLVIEYQTHRSQVHVPDRQMRWALIKRRAHRNLIQILGREPRSEDMIAKLASSLGVEDHVAKRFFLEANRADPEVDYLGKTLYRESKVTLADVLVDPNRPDMTIYDLAPSLPEDMRHALDTLTSREARVLEMRFGIGTGVSCTLESIGKEFGITLERIRQIENKAIRKLRHPSRSRKLKGYLCEE